MSLLGRILEAKRESLDHLRRMRLPCPPPARGFDLLRSPGAPLRLVCEIKHRSPSAGALSTVLSVADRARAYQAAGAAAVSVLTDVTFFDGDLTHLAQARSGCDLPLLCKDFILDEAQLDAARAFGADAALLIVRCLEPHRVAALIGACQERGLAALLEVTTEAEARIALDAGANLVGVNARDLDSLQMDAARAAGVVASLPSDVTAVHLSGLRTPADVTAVAASRADAALVGEALMRQDDPSDLLRDLVRAARG